jgi:Zn-dependent protease
MTCAGCATEIGPSLLSCPTCHTLVYAERLKTLAADAASAGQRGDASAELTAWREALDLLPAGSQQHKSIHAKVQQLSAGLITPAAPADGASGKKMWTGGALSGLAVLLLTKGKLLLLGLTKSSTLLSMIPALGVYWAVFGWRFAAGLIASIYVHEMGHVAALRRFGVAATAPMFIPGLGAVIRGRQRLINPHEEARVGLGGPIWGLGAAAAAFAIYGITGAPIWGAIGHFGAWVNLFNLVPVWQLDGAHAFKAMNRGQRWLATAAIALMFLVTHEGLLVLLAVLAGVQALRGDHHPPGDRVAAAQYAGLIAILSWMSTLSALPHAQ